MSGKNKSNKIRLAEQMNAALSFFPITKLIESVSFYKDKKKYLFPESVTF